MKSSAHKSIPDFAFLLGLAGIIAVTWTGLGQTFNYISITLILISIALIRMSGGQRLSFRGVHLLAWSCLVATFISSIFQLRKSNSVAYLMSKNLSGFPLVSSTDWSPDYLILFKWILSLYALPTFALLVRQSSSIKYGKMLRWWTWSVLLSAIIASFQSVKIFPKFSFINQIGMESGRYAGLSNHPNTQAILICLSLPIVLILFRMNLITKVRFAFVVGVFEFAIFLTGSRNGIVCSLILLILIIFRRYELKYHSHLNFLSIFGACLGIVLVYVVGMLDVLFQNSRLRFYSISADSDASTQGHLALMRYGFDIFVNYPVFGIGPSVLKTFHNIYLQIVGSFGLLGFLAFLYYIRNLFRIEFSRNLKFEYRLIVFTFLLFGMFNNNLADFYLYLPLGLCYASYLDADNPQQKL